MSDNFIAVNIIEAKPIYSTQKTVEGELKELVCGVTMVDSNNNQPINISLNEQSTRIIVLGGLQLLGELGDQIAIDMVNTFMSHVQIPETEDSDEPNSNSFE